MFIDVMKFLLTTVEIVCCVLLIGAILIQKTKSQGAGLAFGSGMGESLFGGQANTVLTKITVILAVVFLTNTAVLTFIATKKQHGRGGTIPAAQAKQPKAPGPQGGSVADPMGASGMPSVPDASSPAPASEQPVAAPIQSSVPAAPVAPSAGGNAEPGQKPAP
jgi:preprotein translocase subunit SecG